MEHNIKEYHLFCIMMVNSLLVACSPYGPLATISSSSVDLLRPEPCAVELIVSYLFPLEDRKKRSNLRTRVLAERGSRLSRSDASLRERTSIRILDILSPLPCLFLRKIGDGRSTARIPQTPPADRQTSFTRSGLFDVKLHHCE